MDSLVQVKFLINTYDFINVLENVKSILVWNFVDYSDMLKVEGLLKDTFVIKGVIFYEWWIIQTKIV